MTYRPGDHYVICDMCGLRRYRSECRKNWKNHLVCADTCWEAKHPQLEIEPRFDRQHVKDPRPEPAMADENFLTEDVSPDDL